MEQYDVKIFPAAKRDLIEVVDYLNTLSPDAAIRYYDLIIAEAATLTTMPARYPLAKDAKLRLRGYRLLPVKNYIIFYRIKGKVVEIRRILYAKRHYENMLF